MKVSTQFDSDQKQLIFIVAGEESGDLHGSFLVKELLNINPNLSFVGHGGNRMKHAGVEIVEHISTLSLVGLTEVVKHLPYMRRVMNDTIELIKRKKPSRVILIDYPGFNLRLAQKIFDLNIPITYFILPQVWAWKENRLDKIKRYIDQPISIIPFEQDWYKSRDVAIDYVGHPLVDLEKPSLNKQAFFNKHSLNIDQPLLALLPGSRQQEIDKHWPVFIETMESLHKTFPKLQYIVGKAPDVKFTNTPSYVKIESENSYFTMAYGTAGLVASGTASLESATFKLPIIVCYKTSSITHLIGKRIAKVKYLSLTNLIADKKIVPELIQHEMNPRQLIKSLVPLLSDTPEREKILRGYKIVLAKLGKKGVYKRTAGLIAGNF